MHELNPTDAQRIDIRTEWPARRATFASCSGDCSQGRRLCITPEACRLADDEDAGKQLPGAGAVVVPFVVGLAVIAAMLAAHFWPR